jgi:flavin reductase (DIM6/NTAB) family NADH-FMN oxidoreductase RutF
VSHFKVITPEEIKSNPFHLIGKEWMLVTAEMDGKVNTMTANWGGVGVMWNLDVVFVVIRPQRYTKEFVDHSSTFSLTFYDQSFKKDLTYLGNKSGRDEDKLSHTSLNLVYDDQTPYFDQAKTVLICKKLFAQEYQKESFIDLGIEKDIYDSNDYHTLYIAEITKVLVSE